jgi:hypothetical protein
MVTVRTYWSLAEAALAKSLLDNYAIPAALLDENASLYNRGAQFAVPVRLVVAEAEAERAVHILSGEFEKADEIELRVAASLFGGEPESPENANRNPWELLVLAFYLLVPAVCLIRTKFPTDLTGRWARHFMARATVTQFLSWLAVFFALLLVVAYFRVRQSSLKSQTEE